MYSGLIVWIKAQQSGEIVGTAAEHSVFVESLQSFAWYFAFTMLMVFFIHRLRFGKKA